jgi:hypothetical protein
MSSDKSAYQLMDDWANIFSVKPLKTKGTLNTKQKGISALEISIPAPTLIRDQEFLTNWRSIMRLSSKLV